ncbi:autophagy-related protein 13 isoform X2 [Rhinatrema bivittatum]|uniref:autophagy-related protein 13 isoform X2 n=1 Tax=Rhinatrema bivittatum TaxID=194408 RepID=UPI00112BC08C|nr:autophagy-related protein 13 isoform X2 [Rhinatrema bivittatum]
MKRRRKLWQGNCLLLVASMCVEISLKTSEGDSMELEIWCLEMNEKCDQDIKVSYTVYNRLSLLLKSLLAITRVTPAYRLSRKQGHEYVILYRIYFGEVQLTGLGEGFQTVRVGTVGTPVGTVTLSCAYRTNLAFMSTRTTCEDQGVTCPTVEESQEVCTTSFSTSPPSQCVFTVTKVHSQTPLPVVMDTLRVPVMGLALSHQLCSSRLSYQPAALGVGSADLSYPVAMAVGTSAAHLHQMVVPGKEGGAAPVSAQPAHGTQAEQDRLVNTAHCPVTTATSSEDTASTCNGDEKAGSPNKHPEILSVRKVGAFVDKPSPQVTYASMDIPFAMFAPKPSEPEETDPMVNPPDSPEEVSPLHVSLQSSSNSSGTAQDDFVMVDFRPAFSKDDLLPMDVGTFYREFQNPPQLSSLSIDIGTQSMAEDLDSLPEKLALHEKNMEEFDAFVDSLQ